MPDVTYSIGDQHIDAYLAVPDGTGPWPGVVMLQDALGMTDDLRGQADTMAAGGYLVIAPDLYSGAATIRCIQQAIRTFVVGKGPVFGYVDAAREFLLDRSDCSGKVGVIGFCMGGAFALMVASGRGFDVASANYGVPLRSTDDMLRQTCPVVGSYGARDVMIPTPMVRRLERRLSEHGIPHDFKIYPDASHSFFQDYSGRLGRMLRVAGITHNPEASRDAWDRIFTFFGEHLAA